MKNTKDKADAYRNFGYSLIKAPSANDSGMKSSVIKPAGDGRSRGGKK